MKPKNKILSLINAGMSSSTLSELNENQINALYQRLVEQVTNKTVTYSEVGPEGGVAPVKPGAKQISMTKDPNKQNTFRLTQTESEVSEENDTDLALAVQSGETNEKFESKKQQKYFFAKCGDGKTKEQKKWCKMAKEFAKSTKDFEKLPEKKEETNEDFTFGDYFTKLAGANAAAISKGVGSSFKPTFEQQLKESIMKMIQKNMSPKMTKKDFIKTIMEAEKEVETPVKPDVDTPSKPKTDNPYQPKHKPAPRAKEKEVETPVKPDVDTPSRPKPATPYQPKHKPAPRAGKLPDWMSFDSIGFNLK
mgnify:CR=1 FL=1